MALRGCFDLPFIIFSFLCFCFVFTAVEKSAVPFFAADIIASLVSSSDYADIVFSFEDGSKIAGHSFIFVASSPVFAAMIRADDRLTPGTSHIETQGVYSGMLNIPLRGVSSKQFQVIKQLLYKDEYLALDGQDAMTLIQVAKRYQIDKVFLLCILFFWFCFYTLLRPVHSLFQFIIVCVLPLYVSWKYYEE